MGSPTSSFGLTQILIKGPKVGGITSCQRRDKGYCENVQIKASSNNLAKIVELKEKYQTAISEAKVKHYKSNSTHFWYRYNKVLGRKTNNIVERIQDTESGLHIFDDQEI